MNSRFILTYLHIKNIFELKKFSTFANLLIEKPGIDLLDLAFVIRKQFINN